MSIDVSFLGQDYSFGDDLKEYVDALRMSEKNSDNLVNAFLSLSKKKGGIIDAAEIKPDLIRKADEYIKKLCNKGVFSKSTEDYVDENDGFKEIERICAEGVSVYKNILVDEINEFQEGMNDAYSEAASNITGTGVRVYTSSLATLALNSAYEYSVLKGQAKKADAQYKKAIDELSDRTEARSDRRRNDFLRNTYYPRMTDALTLFAFGLVQRYISDLITEGKFDDSVLENAEIKKSNTLLDNLKHITNHNSRLECIKQAFEACPFNERVYDTAIDHEAFDSDSFYAAKSFGIDETIVGKLKNKISFSETADLEKKINNKMKYVNAYSICTGTSVSDVLKSSTASIYNSVIICYKDVISSIPSNHVLYKQTYYLSDDDLLNLQDTDIKEKVIKAVKNIVSDLTFDTLINKCGYNSLLKELSDICGDETYYGNKTDLDNAYVEKIYRKLKVEIDKKKHSFTLNRKEAEEQQIKAKADAEIKSKRTIKIVIASLSVIFLLATSILITANIIIPNARYNEAISLMNKEEYENAISVFEQLNGYNDSNTQIENCNNHILEKEYQNAINKIKSKDFDSAIQDFTKLGDYKDSKDKIQEIENEKLYLQAIDFIEADKYEEARGLLLKIIGYKDSNELYYNISEPYYKQGIENYNIGLYNEAIDNFTLAGTYKDSKDYLSHINGIIEIGTYDKLSDEEKVKSINSILLALKNLLKINNQNSIRISSIILDDYNGLANKYFEENNYLLFSNIAFELNQYGFISDDLLKKYNDYIKRFDLNGVYKCENDTKEYYYEISVNLAQQKLTITHVSWIKSDIFKSKKDFTINWDNHYEKSIEGYTIVYELSATYGTLKQIIKENNSDFSATSIFKKQ